MEAIIAFMLLKFIQTFDRESLLILHRISLGCKHYAHSRVILKLKVELVQGAIDTCLDHIDDIILHARKHYLRLRIAEPGIVFQHLRSVCREHQSKEDHAFERTSFCCHSVHGRLIDIPVTELLYLFCIERTGGECSHSSRIQTCISVPGTLVVLGARHRLNRLAVHKREH